MLKLFSTEGCHLCEMAYEQLVSLGIQSQVEVVDIAFNDDLFSRYGVTIPVLALNEADNKHQKQPQELFWPFNTEELQVWLKQNGINYHS
ncbi:glutaredoxin family protein [Vibrio rumoiensis]|uniref:NrdH-redoxin n=1 Tax=Vibrio rumoiensis 1S-45 TaxID=1188252 RepID=A0A1E5E6N9_9VIBR|nr:glutaredoxin family protein [Vibrio rumoiensis]OEF30191.1 NrdH-redoxin [Vibrio rumoiensis 1S-45]